MYKEMKKMKKMLGYKPSEKVNINDFIAPLIGAILIVLGPIAIAIVANWIRGV